MAIPQHIKRGLTTEARDLFPMYGTAPDIRTSQQEAYLSGAERGWELRTPRLPDETLWKVTWFPPEQDHVTKTGTEEQVRRLAEKHAEWNPVIEYTEIAWTLVETHSSVWKMGGE